MDNKYKLLGLFVLMVLILWNLWSLQYSPIAWYDEVFFASITHSLTTGNGFGLGVDNGEPLYIYGPIYFILTGCVEKVLGFGLFSFRLTSILAAFLSVFLLYSICTEIKQNRRLSALVVLLFATDALFVSVSHSGRMEFVAVAFVLASYKCFLKYRANPEHHPMVYISLLSLCLTFAFLTTPRSAIVAAPLAIYTLCILVLNRKWTLTCIYSFIPMLFVFAWILYAYGSLQAMIDAYSKTSSVSQDASMIERFLGGNFYIPKNDIPLIGFACISLIYIIKKIHLSEFIMYICPILLFYVLVTDTGMYSVYILPFYCIIIFLGVITIKPFDKRIKILYYFCLFLCLIVNMGIYGYKIYIVGTSIEQRDNKALSEWVSKNIPDGSSVVGSCSYYYSITSNNCKFRRLFKDYCSTDSVYNEIITQFHPDYLFLLDEETTPEAVSCAEMFKKQKVDRYEPIQKERKNNAVFKNSYAGTLYKIIY